MNLDYDEDMIKLNLDQERQAYQAQLEAEQEEREPGTTGPKKMGLIFFAIAGILCVVADVIDFFTGGTIGWFIGLFVDGILLLMFGLSSAGRKQFKRIIGGLVGESFPIIATLPLRTIFLCWAFISSRSKIARKVEDRVEHQIYKAAPVINTVSRITQPTKTSVPNPIKKTGDNGQSKIAA